MLISGYELNEEFKKDKYNYTITVPYSKTALLAEEVTAIPEDAKATVQKTSGLALSTIGKNKYVILVTARDGFTTSSYVVDVIREKNNDSTLINLNPTIGVFTEVFRPDKTEYVWQIPSSVKTVTKEMIEYELSDKNATVELTEKIDMTDETSDKTFKVKVTSQDGNSVTEYILHLETVYKKIQLTGKIITDNECSKHVAEITIYDSATKEEVRKGTSDENGEFAIGTILGIYDMVVTKLGYLSYTLTNVNLSDAMEENVNIGEIKIYAGDMHENGEINIDDLVLMNDMYHEDISTKEKYDITGDGVIDTKDRNVLKRNYGRKAEINEY